MRPYKFRIRLSSKRLNVTRLGKGPAAALRTAARLSLGSASSDIELMGAPPVIHLHDRADRPPLQEPRGQRRSNSRAVDGPLTQKNPKSPVTGSLERTIIP